MATVQLIDQQGVVYNIDESAADRQAKRLGWRLATDEEVQGYDSQKAKDAELQAKHGGLGSQAVLAGEKFAAATEETIASVISPLATAVGVPEEVSSLRFFGRAPGAEERAEASPVTAQVAAAAPAVLSGFAGPAGLAGAAGRAALGGLLEEGGQTVIRGDEFSMQDAAFAGLIQGSLETGMTRILGKAFGGAGALETSGQKAAKSMVTDAAREAPGPVGAAKRAVLGAEVLEQHVDELADTLAGLEVRAAKAQEKVMSDAAVRRAIKKNAKAQDEASLTMAQLLNRASATLSGNAKKAFQEAAEAVATAKGGVKQWQAHRIARETLERLEDVTPGSQAALKALADSTESKALWGGVTDNYKVVRAAGEAPADRITKESVTDILNNPNSRQALQDRLDALTGQARATRDTELLDHIEDVRKAVSTADGIVGEAALAGTLVDDIPVGLKGTLDDLAKRRGAEGGGLPQGMSSKSGRGVTRPARGTDRQSASLQRRIDAHGDKPEFVELVREAAAVARKTPFGPGNEKVLFELQKDVLEEFSDLFPRVSAADVPVAGLAGKVPSGITGEAAIAGTVAGKVPKGIAGELGELLKGKGAKAVARGAQSALTGAGFAVGGPIGGMIGDVIGDVVVPKALKIGKEILSRPDSVNKVRGILGTLKDSAALNINTAARSVVDKTVQAAHSSIPVAAASGSAGIMNFIGPHEDVRSAFEEKTELLREMQQNPVGMIEDLSESLPELQDAAPELHAQIVGQTFRVAQYIQGKIPETIGVSLSSPSGIPPSKLAIRQFALFYSAATDPSTVIEDVKNNRVRQEQIQTLREVWPDIYSNLKSQVLQEMASGSASVRQRMRMDLLFDFGASLDGGLSWNLATVNDRVRAEQAEGQGGKTPERKTQPSIAAIQPVGTAQAGLRASTTV